MDSQRFINPLARAQAGGARAVPAGDSVSSDDEVDASVSALRAFYAAQRYASQQAREISRQQRVIEQFRSERNAKEQSAAEMRDIRRAMEREEVLRLGDEGVRTGDATPSDDDASSDDEAAGRDHEPHERMADAAVWEEHEARWAAFEAAPPEDITARRRGHVRRRHQPHAPQEAAVPWPPAPRPASGLLLCARAQPLSRRRAVRLALQRWHPDRFLQRYGPRLAPGEQREAVLARVTALAAAITTGRG